MQITANNLEHFTRKISNHEERKYIKALEIQKHSGHLSPVYTTLNFWYSTDKICTRTTFLALGLPI